MGLKMLFCHIVMFSGPFINSFRHFAATFRLVSDGVQRFPLRFQAIFRVSDSRFQSQPIRGGGGEHHDSVLTWWPLSRYGRIIHVYAALILEWIISLSRKKMHIAFFRPRLACACWLLTEKIRANRQWMRMALLTQSKLKRMGHQHSSVNHQSGEYARQSSQYDGVVVHTNSIECVWGSYKNWLRGMNKELTLFLDVHSLLCFILQS